MENEMKPTRQYVDIRRSFYSMPAILGIPYDLSHQSYDTDPYATFYKRIFRDDERAMEIQAFLQIVNRPDPDKERILERLAIELGHAD